VVGLLARYRNLSRSTPLRLLSHPAVLVVSRFLACGSDFVADKIPVVTNALHVVGLFIHPSLGLSWPWLPKFVRWSAILFSRLSAAGVGGGDPRHARRGATGGTVATGGLRPV